MNRKKRVLVVEDEAITALDIERCLTDCGYEIVGIASNCEDALALAAARPPDVALMDFELKGPVNGATVAREFHDRGVRIIFLTAFLDRVVRDAYDYADGFLGKPVLRDELKQSLEEILDAKATPAARSL